MNTIVKKSLEILVFGLALAGSAEAQMTMTMTERSTPSQNPVTAKFEVKGSVYGDQGSVMLDSLTGKGKIDIFFSDMYVRQLKAKNHFLMKDSVGVNNNVSLDWELIEARPITSTYYNNILEVMSAVMGFQIGRDALLCRFPTGNIQVHHINRPAIYKAVFDSMKTDLHNKTNGIITFTEDNTASSTGWNIKYVTDQQWPQGTPLEPGWTDPAVPESDGKTIKSVISYILIGYGPAQDVISREALRAIGGNDDARDPNYVSYHGGGENGTFVRFHPDEGKAIENMYKMKIGTNLKLYQNKIVSDYTDVKINNEPNIPNQFMLEQNFPNPFNPTTTICYNLDKVNVAVSLRVYDVLGREVAVLTNEEKPAGKYTQTWNASSLPSGVYFYQLISGTYTFTRKMLLLK
jgi:hypothetical protein